jgi:hypothetical protein
VLDELAQVRAQAAEVSERNAAGGRLALPWQAMMRAPTLSPAFPAQLFAPSLPCCSALSPLHLAPRTPPSGSAQLRSSARMPRAAPRRQRPSRGSCRRRRRRWARSSTRRRPRRPRATRRWAPWPSTARRWARRTGSCATAWRRRRRSCSGTPRRRRARAPPRRSRSCGWSGGAPRARRRWTAPRRS